MNVKRFRQIGGGLLLLALVGLPVRTWSQCPLSIRVSNTPVQQLSLGDIDFEHFQSRTLLFTMAIGNSSASSSNAIVEITVDVLLADGSKFLPAISFKSSPFPVKAGGQTFTNLDLGPTSTITGKVDYDQQAKDRLNDVVLGTGLFPAGRYSFVVRVMCEDGSGPQDGRFTLILRNSSRLELRSPRDGEATNQFPLLEYFSDAADVRLIVGEMMSGDSRQDAITRQPPMLETELHGQNSFFYAGGRPLEAGKTYAWQVVAKNIVSGGTNNEMKSEIRRFTVTLPGMSQDELLLQIERMLGPKYKSVFDKIRSGEYTLNGKYSNNNIPLTQGELLNLVNELRDALDNAEVVFE